MPTTTAEPTIQELKEALEELELGIGRSLYAFEKRYGVMPTNVGPGSRQVFDEAVGDYVPGIKVTLEF